MFDADKMTMVIDTCNFAMHPGTEAVDAGLKHSVECIFNQRGIILKPHHTLTSDTKLLQLILLKCNKVSVHSTFMIMDRLCDIVEALSSWLPGTPPSFCTDNSF